MGVNFLLYISSIGAQIWRGVIFRAQQRKVDVPIIPLNTGLKPTEDSPIWYYSNPQFTLFLMTPNIWVVSSNLFVSKANRGWEVSESATAENAFDDKIPFPCGIMNP